MARRRSSQTDEFYTPEEFARIVRCGVRVVRRGMRDGLVPHLRLGERVARIPKSALTAAIVEALMRPTKRNIAG